MALETSEATIAVALPCTKANLDTPRPRARRVNDACKILQISRSHLYAMAAKGMVRLVRIGNRTVVPESEIDRLLGDAG